jgi:hypothetical protein
MLQPYRRRCQCARREPPHVRRAVEASLKRLGTDRVDVLFLHHYDAHAPLEEHMRSLEDVVRSGKVLYPALSNYSAWQTQAALGYQQRNGWAPLQVIQPMYSLVKRQAEVELLPMAQANGDRRGGLQPRGRRPAVRAATCKPAQPDATPPTRCTRRAIATSGCTRPPRSSSPSARSAAGTP